MLGSMLIFLTASGIFEVNLSEVQGSDGSWCLAIDVLVCLGAKLASRRLFLCSLVDGFLLGMEELMI